MHLIARYRVNLVCPNCPQLIATVRQQNQRQPAKEQCCAKQQARPETLLIRRLAWLEHLVFIVVHGHAPLAYQRRLIISAMSRSATLKEPPTIMPATLSTQSGIIGAAYLKALGR